RTAFEPGGEEAAIERVTRSGGVDRANARRRRSDVGRGGAAGNPAASPRSELDDRVPRGAAPERQRGRAPPGARVQSRLRLVDEDEVGGAEQGREPGCVAQ